MFKLVTVRGDYRKTKKWMEDMRKHEFYNRLEKYAREGVEALSNSTPIDSGKTASSWGYRIEQDADVARIVWTNSNINQGVPIAIIIQYGHGTGTGGYVQGRDYINPAMQPVFDRIVEEVSKEVRSL